MKEKIEPYVVYATIDDLNNEARTRANNDGLINNSLNLLSNDYQSFKSTTNATLNNKQNKNDNTLITTNKTVVGAINELKSVNDTQTTNINQNTGDINNIKSDYIKASDLGNELDTKQDKTDDGLNTTDKTVVGAINEIKSVNDTQTTNINQNTADITEIKTDYVKGSDLGNQLDIKQNKTDDGLNTTDKTVVGAINEIKSVNDTQTTNINQNTTNISQNTNDINQIKTDYVKSSDLGNELDTKQDKTDNELNTTNKTVVGAINEIKSVNDTQTTNINQNTTNISQNTNDINQIKTDYVKGSDLGNQLDIKQNKTDDGLNTTIKTVVGAINEIKSVNDTQTTNINQNTADITEIKTDYVKSSDLGNELDTKQDKTDDGLNTTDKTVVGAINEIKSVNDTQTTNINQNTTNISQNTNDINQIKTDYVKSSDLGNELDTKQDKTDNELNTTNKTVVGAINEIKSVNDTQTTNINQNTTNISQNTNDINQIKTDYVKGSDLGNQLDIKQNKTDDGLNTTIKTVVGAINEIKSVNDTQTTNINQNTADITEIKTDYVKSSDLGNELDTKQDKTDDGLNTTDKTVVGAINEIKSVNDTQTTNINQNTTNISQNTNDINQIKTDYVKSSDLGNELDTKQDKTDNELNTTNKTVVGAINEIKSVNDTQTTNINQNTTNITQNTNDINQIKTDYVKSSDLGNELDTKQDKTDNELNTTNKTVVGAINEIKSVNDTQTTNINQNTTNISQNTNDINQIKTDYVKGSDLGNELDTKQDKNDTSLATSNKTVVGAINELNTIKVSDIDFESFQESVLQYQNITNNALNNKQDKYDVDLTTSDITVVGAINELKIISDNQTTSINTNTNDINNIQTNYMKTSTANSALALKQNITDNALNTTNKTIVGAINEIKTSAQIWTAVGTSVNARTWNYNLTTNKKYRIAYNWSASDTTSKIYKEFTWTGTNISLETYSDTFPSIYIQLLNLTLLGSANVVELIATSTGIQISTKIGSSTIGRIIALEQAS
ncbi:hypothetical protein [Spiroplasma platyhelix]|uniref:Uncharacterized protein n=1 Tax=Spiroplasma platyhelix PALS-1 TaxID=1276218 RepID=A0A846U4V9_9MOLU|nr:hypothetical protein [Spiroplasma platyhelix]MBE4704127.1 hypothetical protein [Spiroplasma platyhelix PALS-1]NKE38497.1 hypothetical protein [Spiroplasma platyhelix PALS-1]